MYSFSSIGQMYFTLFLYLILFPTLPFVVRIILLFISYV